MNDIKVLEEFIKSIRSDLEEDAKVILNLIEKLKVELNKKDKKIVILEQMNKQLQEDFNNYKNDKDINYLNGIHHKQLVQKSLGQTIDNPEEIWFDAVEVKIIRNNILYSVNIEKDFITLKEISGEKPDECITVIAESPLSGAIYRYNSYGKKEWQLVGTMVGYA